MGNKSGRMMIGYGVRGRERQRKLRIVSAFVFYCHESQKGKTIFPHRLRSRREIVFICYFVAGGVGESRALLYRKWRSGESLFFQFCMHKTTKWKHASLSQRQRQREARWRGCEKRKAFNHQIKNTTS